jgi:ferritin-like metal-binding protein YciE
MKLQSLRDLFVDELKDVYDAENRLVKALPKMAKSASSPQLRDAFTDHLEKTGAIWSGWNKFSAAWESRPKRSRAME